MNITVYQNVYDLKLLNSVSADATPLIRKTNPAGVFEYGAFKELKESGLPTGCEYIGLFSTKFAQKMMITVGEAKRFVSSHPGYDVYSFNPYPYESYIFFNQWESSEFHHPGIKSLVQDVFDHFGLGDLATSPRMKSSDSGFCNFWIGSKSFFNEYTDFMLRVGEFMLQNEEKFLKNSWHMDEVSTPYFPMIIEFLFSLYVKRNLHRWKHLSYPNPKELYDILIPDDSPIRFEKKRQHFQMVRALIELLDDEYHGIDSSEAYRSKFQKINQSASTLLKDGIEKLYVPKKILR